MSKKVYEIVTNKIIQELEKGKIPWKKPWKSTNHANFVSKKEYRGINPLLLDITASEKGYTCNYWVSFAQTKKLKGKVKKNEKSTIIIFWKMIEKKNEEGEIEKTFPYLQYHRVFNLEQTTLEIPEKEKEDTLDFIPLEKAEKIVQGMKNKPEIFHRGNKAYYDYNKDIISLPEKEKFSSVEGYYSVLFHELTHSTGHSARLNRPIKNFFGSEKYSKEELTAEIGASMLNGICGIFDQTLKENTAYIQSWLSVLKNDSKLIVQSASLAQKSCDYILGL